MRKVAKKNGKKVSRKKGFSQSDALSPSTSSGTTCRSGAKKVKTPPNILFIFSDDHATHAIGAYGPKHNKPDLHKYVKTPYVDHHADHRVSDMKIRLAAERVTVGDTVEMQATLRHYR